MSQPTINLQIEPETKPRITTRAIILGTATAAGLNLYGNYAGMILGSSSLVKSQLPIAMLLPFVLWLGINILLKGFWPRVALSSAELLVIYSMSWIVGTLSASGWTAYWGGILSSPTFFASPENRWEDVLFDVMPWHMLPHGENVVKTYYEGLPDGLPIPWSGWFSTLYWWLSISLALVLSGFCISFLFQKQWENAERLTFPLAVFPMALTEGFDQKDRLPAIFKNSFFLIGFGIVFGVYAWNMVGYFVQAFPRIGIFDPYPTKEVALARQFPSIYLRILPPVIGLTYLCNLDILFSLWAFRFIAILKEGFMARVGFAIGYAGQQAEAGDILTLESHGALFFLALYAVYVARHHLFRVCQLACTSTNREARSYRLALLGLMACTWGDENRPN